ncbi:MAG: SPOR domain-containing protein [Rhodovibrionaceae bacterium]|nr:SPOR domain-containing protein [Rhodovibrionaceae bacterium]
MPSEYSPEELRAAREARERRSQVSDDMPEFLEEPLPQPEARPARNNAVKIASMVISLLTLAGFAAIVSYAYLWGLGDVSEGKLPIVAAAAEPEKVRPEDPGGLKVPHQDTLVLNESDSGAETGVERLLPPPEEPAPPEPKITASNEGGQTPPSEDAAGAEVPQPSLEPTEPIQLMPEKTKAAISGTAAPDSEAPGADAGTQVAEANSDAAPKLAPEPEASTNEAAAKAEAAPSPAATQVALKPGDYVIQMAAFRSDDRARQGWRALQGSHPQILGDMELLIQQVDIEGKGTFFRVQTGPFPNKATAEDMCAALKARGQACIVTRR